MNVLERLSIRVRITLGTVLLALAFFAAAGLVGHALVERLLDDSTTRLLHADITPFETAIHDEPDDAVDAPADGQLVAVVDPSGAERVSTLPESLQRSLGELASAPEGPRSIAVGDSRFLVMAEQVEAGDGAWTIVAARDQGTRDEVLAKLSAGLLVGVGVIATVFGAASWLLTGSALRPVSRLRASAEDIVGSGSDELLPVGPAQDEIHALAGTLNDLIMDLRSSAARERQLVSDASHELRTPLAVLQGRLELLRAGDRSRLDEDVAAAEDAARRMARLVADLLELSRLESTDVTAGSAGADDLVHEVGGAVDRARLTAAGREITIDLTIDAPSAPLGRAAIRPATFGRVVDNLVGNAVEAIGTAGGVEVVLALTPTTAILTVSDDGPGIDPSFLPRAFDRFSQPEAAGRSSTGSGLGLAIVSAATAGAGGSVALADREPHGVRATVALPLRSGSEVV